MVDWPGPTSAWSLGPDDRSICRQCASPHICGKSAFHDHSAVSTVDRVRRTGGSHFDGSLGDLSADHCSSSHWRFFGTGEVETRELRKGEKAERPKAVSVASIVGDGD